MEDGRLTDSKGRKVDFKNTIIIMTSNVGSDFLRRQSIGYDNASVKTADVERTDFEKRVFSLLKDSFRPEFLNRVDEIIIFGSLNKEDIKVIAKRMIEKTRKMLAEQGITIKMDSKVIEYFAENGYSDDYGARPLRRLIQKELDNELSSKIINSDLQPGDMVLVTVKSGEIKVTVKAPAKMLNLKH